MSDTAQFPGSRFMRKPSPHGFGVQLSMREDRSAFACFQFDADKEGPPHYAHGGAVATVLDEAMGAAAFFANRLGFTLTMTVNYRASAPLLTDLHVLARVVRIEGKKTHVTAEIVLPEDGTVLADAVGLFYTSEELRERILQRYVQDTSKDEF